MEEAMRKKLVSAFLAAALTVSALTGCSSQTGADAKGESTAAEQKTEAEESKAGETAAEEGKEAASDEAYKIGIVTPTVTVSEDEFRGAQEMVEKHPELVVPLTKRDVFPLSPALLMIRR